MPIVTASGVIDESDGESIVTPVRVIAASGIVDDGSTELSGPFSVSTEEGAGREGERAEVGPPGPARVPSVVEVARRERELEIARERRGWSWDMRVPTRGDPDYTGPLDWHPSIEHVRSHSVVWMMAQIRNPRYPYGYMRDGVPLLPEDVEIEPRREGEETWDDWNFGPEITVDQELTGRSLVYLGEWQCRAVSTVMYNNQLYNIVCGRRAVAPGRRCAHSRCNWDRRRVHLCRGYFRRIPAGIFDNDVHGWGNQYTGLDGYRRVLAATATRRSPRLGQPVPSETGTAAERRVRRMPMVTSEHRVERE